MNLTIRSITRAVVCTGAFAFTLAAAPAIARACDNNNPSWANRDDDGDGICNGADNCPYEPNADQNPSACAMAAITVPWIPANPAFPHSIRTGVATTLKGIARYGGDQFNWDFGDGTSTGFMGIGNAWNLGVSHTYNGNSGQLFIATLTVRNSSTGATASATYPLKIQDSFDTSDPAQMDVRVNIAIDEGLWFLHLRQNRSTAGDGSPGWNQPYGWWDSLQGSCAAVDALELHGSQPQSNNSTDPYVEDVRRGLNYMLLNAGVAGIGGVTKFTWAATSGSPDVNGNGLAIYLGNNSTYVDGICATAFASSHAPGKTAQVGNGYIYGRTYKDLTQDMVDWFAYGQSDCGPQYGNSGGWWYAANYGCGADGSTNQWPILAMSAAEDAMGATVPPFVRANIPIFINNTFNAQHDNNNGGWGYTAPSSIPNIVKTGAGILAHYFLGDSQQHPAVLEGIGYMYRHWNDNDGCWTVNLGNSYTMFGVMKSMRKLTPNILRLTDYDYNNGVQTSNSFDWYYTPSGQSNTGIATNVVGRQHGDGSWRDSNGCNAGISTDHTTAWDTVILNKAVTTIPPQAVICNCSATWDENQDVVLDGSCSVEPDPSRHIRKYDWDFAYNGTSFQQTIGADGFGITGQQATIVGGFSTYTEDSTGAPNGVTHPVALRVTDDNPNSLGGPQVSIASCNVIIKPPPHCPSPVVGGPYLGKPNIPVQLDASASFDVDSDPITFAWDFHNTNTFADATGATPTATFTTVGTFPIGVQVTDHPDQNAHPYSAPSCSKQAYTTVQVGAHPPVANAGGPYSTTPGTSINLNGNGSTDPDGGALTFAWDLSGNGLYNDSTSATPTFNVGASVAVGTSFTVCLKVTNPSNLSNVACANVLVVKEHLPPTCTIIAPVEMDSCNGGAQAVALDGRRSSDPNDDAITFAWTSDCNGTIENSSASLTAIDFNTANNGCSKSCTAHLTVSNAFLSSTCDKTITITDQTGPVLSAPSSTSFECGPTTSSDVANWLAGTSAADLCSTAGTPGNDFIPATGNLFNACGGVGVNQSVLVTFSDTDSCGNTSQKSAILQITDHTPPTLSLPGDLSAEATGPGTTFSWSATANDFVSGALSVTCTPASGSQFAAGTTTVNCQSTDAAGNTGTGSFTVTVNDTTPPVLSLPANFLVPATSLSGTIVTFTATATDLVDGSVPVTCTPASGTAFPAGIDTVNCSATDSHGNTSTGSFVVTVWSQPPHIVITNPANGSVQAGPTTGLAWQNAPDYNPPPGIYIANVVYTFDGVQIYSGAPSGAPTSRSLATYLPGPHTFAVTATDNLTNQGSATSTFTYSPTIATLIALTCAGPNQLPGFAALNQGQQNSLCVKLKNAAADVAKGHYKAAVGILNAYEKEIDAYTKTGKLPQAADNIADADGNYVITQLCGLAATQGHPNKDDPDGDADDGGRCGPKDTDTSHKDKDDGAKHASNDH